MLNGIPKITDFGLAKIANGTTRTKTFKGWGSRLYMAPEAFSYTENTIQMDIYSMGIVFYQLATLKYPYTPIPTSEEEAKNTHLIKAITPPTNLIIFCCQNFQFPNRFAKNIQKYHPN